MIWLVALVLLPIVYLLYNRWSWIHSYWEFRAVPGPTPLPFIGNMLQYIVGRKSLGELGLQWSREFRDTPLVGFYSFMKPYVLVNRSDYVETVLVDEFSNFTDRLESRPGKTGSERLLTQASGATWKTLRAKIAPIFVAEKQKGMFDRFKVCSEKTLDIVDENLSRDLAATEFIKTYAVEISARTIFGLETEDLSEFTKEYEKATDSSGTRRFNKLIYYGFPRLAEFMQISFVPRDQEAFFKKTLQETFRRRKVAGAKVNDVAQLLLELKEKGQLDVETWDEAEDKYLRTEPLNTCENLDITDELLTGQALDLLTIGVDTVFSAITFTLLELCCNQQVMDKLVQEIRIVVERHKHFTYQALEDMKYLDMCLMEALRLHPTVPALTRCCTRNYTFDNGLQVEKGMMMCVPVLAVHSDPEVYPDPAVFRPERFLTPPPPSSYLPFGDGPRMCIGKKMSLVVMKGLLSRLVSKYEVRLSRKTRLPVVLAARSVVSSPQSPVYFNFTPRSESPNFT